MDSIDPRNFYTEKQIENAKKLGEKARKVIGVHAMSEAELTEEERESRVPLKRSTKGYYRMYRWECQVCLTHGKKMPYSEAIASGYQHAIEFKHPSDPFNPPVRVIGGVFPKEELYHE